MAYDLLKEMRASKESYDFFGLLKEADKWSQINLFMSFSV